VSVASSLTIPRQYSYFTEASYSVLSWKIMRPGITVRLRESRPNFATLARYAITFSAAILGLGCMIKMASARCTRQDIVRC